MTRPTPSDKLLAREARHVAVVIVVAMVGWLGAKLGWDASYAFLFDLAALAAFFWALVVTWRIWQRQRDAGK